MAGTPPDLSTFKPVAGQPLAAAQIANGLTAIESWATNAIDPASMLQKAATIGQAMVWNGTIWAPGGYTAASPTMILGAMIPNGNTTAAANTAYLMPIPGVAVPTTISRIGFYVNTGGGTGNVDVGIYYSDDDATFTRLVSKGSTATPAGGATLLSISATTITPVTGRRWYLAFACNNATPTFGANTSGNTFGNTYSKTTSFPLPSSLASMSTTGTGQQFFLYGLV